MQSKEIQALGAFNREDRSIAMDMLGFKKQLVFATHSIVTPFRDLSRLNMYKQGVKVTPELRYEEQGLICQQIMGNVRFLFG